MTTKQEVDRKLWSVRSSTSVRKVFRTVFPFACARRNVRHFFLGGLWHCRACFGPVDRVLVVVSLSLDERDDLATTDPAANKSRVQGFKP